jgi:hypothetical protein
MVPAAQGRPVQPPSLRLTQLWLDQLQLVPSGGDSGPVRDSSERRLVAV